MRAYTGKLTLDVVASDPAIQLYLARRIEKYGRIPITVGTRIRTAAYKFLRLNGIEPTNHAFSDLVAQKRMVPVTQPSPLTSNIVQPPTATATSGPYSVTLMFPPPI